MRLATCHELPDVDEALVRLQEVGLQKELFGPLFSEAHFGSSLLLLQAYSINLA